MAEAVAAIGLVASIVNIVGFGSTLVSRLHSFRSNTIALPALFQSVADQLPLLLRVLDRVRSRLETSSINAEDANSLAPVILAASSDVKALNEILDQAIPQNEASSLERASKALKSLSLDKETTTLLARIHSHIQLLVFAQTLDYADLQGQLSQLVSAQTTLPINAGSKRYNRGLNMGAAPQIQDDYFVGRMPELERLREYLSPQSDPPTQKVVSIVGMGGLGKTQLSLAYAKKHASLYSAIFWLNAKDEPSLKRSLTQAHSTIADSPHGDLLPTDEKIRHFKRWLSEEENNRWLLIFDNYDNPKLANSTPNTNNTTFDIRGFFPHRAHGNILITTRSTRLVFSRQLRLKTLTDPEQSLDILASRSGRDIRNDPDAQRLSDRLEGLPLALATAGAYLSQTSESCGGYLDAYEKAWKDLRTTDELEEYQERKLFTTWNISYQQVLLRDPQAAAMLKFLAYFDNKDIWYDLVYDAAHDIQDTPAPEPKVQKPSNLAVAAPVPTPPPPSPTPSASESKRSRLAQRFKLLTSEKKQPVSVSNAIPLVHRAKERPPQPQASVLLQRATSTKQSFDQCMSRLIDYCLIEASEKGYSMHSCIHDWTLGELNDPVDTNYLIAVISAVGRFVCQYTDDEYWVTNRRLLPHARRLQHPSFVASKRVTDQSAAALEGLTFIGYLYSLEYEFPSSELIYDRAIRSSVANLGLNHPRTIELKRHLGQLYRHMGRYSDALEILKSVHKTAEASLGPDDQITLDATYNLAVVSLDYDDYAQAAALFGQCMKIHESLGEERTLNGEEDHKLDVEAMEIRICLGDVYRLYGKCDLARPLLMQASIEAASGLGGNNDTTTAAAVSLGWLYFEEGNLAEAEKLCTGALETHRIGLGPDHPVTRECLCGLADIYRYQGRLDEAEEALSSSLPGLQATYGKDHHAILSCEFSLGATYVDQEKFDQAEAILDRVSLYWREKVGPASEGVAACAAQLGKIYHKQERFAEAEASFKHAYLVYNRINTPEALAALDCLCELGKFYHQQGRLDEAKDNLTRALAMHQSRNLPNSEFLLMCYYEVARLCRSRKEWDEAERAFNEARAGFERLYGSDCTWIKTIDQALNELRTERANDPAAVAT